MRYLLIALLSFPVIAAPNMELKEGSVACKTLRSLNYAERMKMQEPVLEVQKAEVNNNCTTTTKNKKVTAFDVGVTSKVEMYSLGSLDVFYVNSRDLVNDHPHHQQ